MVVWREAEVTYLIDLIKTHDFIWNTSSPDFKDKHKKFKFWGFAAFKINTAFNPSIAFDRKDCFKKWNNLRTYFYTEMKSVKTRNEGDTADTKGFINNSWKYSMQMSFLVEDHLPNATESNFNNMNEPVFDDDFYNGSEIDVGKPALLLENSEQQQNNASMENTNDSFTEPPYKRYKKESAEESDDPLQYVNMHMTQQSNKEQETASYFYGRYVGQCLDKLNDDLNLEARQKINQILFQCEKAQLERQ